MKTSKKTIWPLIGVLVVIALSASLYYLTKKDVQFSVSGPDSSQFIFNGTQLVDVRIQLSRTTVEIPLAYGGYNIYPENAQQVCTLNGYGDAISTRDIPGANLATNWATLLNGQIVPQNNVADRPMLVTCESGTESVGSFTLAKPYTAQENISALRLDAAINKHGGTVNTYVIYDGTKTKFVDNVAVVSIPAGKQYNIEFELIRLSQTSPSVAYLFSVTPTTVEGTQDQTSYLGIGIVAVLLIGVYFVFFKQNGKKKKKKE